MGTSERDWRGHLADTVEAARQAEAWNLAWIREGCDEAEWRAAESRLEAKKAELVEAVEKEYQRGWDDAMKPHVEASYD